jgi:hypothetical protein
MWQSSYRISLHPRKKNATFFLQNVVRLLLPTELGQDGTTRTAENAVRRSTHSGNCAKIAPKKRHFGHSGNSDRFYNQQLTETKGANPGSTPAASTNLIYLILFNLFIGVGGICGHYV